MPGVPVRADTGRGPATRKVVVTMSDTFESYEAMRESRTASAKKVTAPSAARERALAQALAAAYYHEVHADAHDTTTNLEPEPEDRETS
jgi:hypothetical protein